MKPSFMQDLPYIMGMRTFCVDAPTELDTGSTTGSVMSIVFRFCSLCHLRADHTGAGTKAYISVHRYTKRTVTAYVMSIEENYR